MSSNNRKKKDFSPTIEVETTETVEPILEEKAALKAKVAHCERVNFRAEPEGEKIAILDAGLEVEVIEQDTVWSFVSVNGKQGYIMTEFLEVE